MKSIVNGKIEWEIDEFCKYINIDIRQDLVKQGIGYLYVYPIIYNGEIMGPANEGW